MTRQARYKKRKPWVRYLEYARRRCRDTGYRNYAIYGGRGIECRLTLEDVRFLWENDNAARLVTPSLDRIDSDGHYERINCAFVEHRENSLKAASKRWKNRGEKENG